MVVSVAQQHQRAMSALGQKRSFSQFLLCTMRDQYLAPARSPNYSFNLRDAAACVNLETITRAEKGSDFGPSDQGEDTVPSGAFNQLFGATDRAPLPNYPIRRRPAKDDNDAC